MWYNKYPKHMKEQTMKKTDYAYYDPVSYTHLSYEGKAY